jgi:hypothetical protein
MKYFRDRKRLRTTVSALAMFLLVAGPAISGQTPATNNRVQNASASEKRSFSRTDTARSITPVSGIAGGATTILAGAVLLWQTGTIGTVTYFFSPRRPGCRQGTPC